jgi:Mrp family chromosome partitioning ATPase
LFENSNPCDTMQPRRDAPSAHAAFHALFRKKVYMAANTAPLSDEEKAALQGCGEDKGPTVLEPNGRSTIHHVIGVVSGKGGVGKSLVTSLLASEANKRGKKVGILDADVTGPSIPKTFGITNPLTADNDGILPAQTQSGIKVVSTNLMLPEDDMPIAWRGPVVSNAIRQFFNETNWGEIDYLFVDMPPGTSDVLLTVFQSLPVDGIVTVSAPQELVAMIVGKAVNLATEMNVKTLGLVENMAYFECPDCGKKHYIFGEPQGKEVAEKYHIPAYATLPIDPKFAALCDEGKVEEYDVAGRLDPVIAEIEKVPERA